MRLLLASVGVLALSCADPRPDSEEVTVFAAASLRDACIELAEMHERDVGTRLRFNFGSSSDLANQILASDVAEIFLSADQVQMDRVEAAGRVVPGSRTAWLSNRLVVVVPSDSEARIEGAADLVAMARLSLAHPEAVPAGRYARLWLEEAGLWERLRERVVPAIDVRAALYAVESGAVPAGVVYATDAGRSGRVRVAYELPAERGPDIRYSAAALSERAAARAALAFLTGAPARGVYDELGFRTPEGSH